MSDLFETAVDFVLDVERGLVDDSSDPGGLTKFGISQRAYPDLNIRELTIEQAKTIYRHDYWDCCSCDKLPAGSALILFDHLGLAILSDDHCPPVRHLLDDFGSPIL